MIEKEHEKVEHHEDLKLESGMAQDISSNHATVVLTATEARKFRAIWKHQLRLKGI